MLTGWREDTLTERGELVRLLSATSGRESTIILSPLQIACFLLTFTFPILNAALGAAGTFWLYAGICFTGFAFVLGCVPETKGKSLEQIECEVAAAK